MPRKLETKLIYRQCRNQEVFETGKSATAGVRLVMWLFSLLGIFQVLDLHSTFLALAQKRSETNGLILYVAHVTGIYGAVVLFKVLAIAVGVLYYKCYRQFNGKKYVVIPLLVLNCIYALVVINNYSA